MKVQKQALLFIFILLHTMADAQFFAPKNYPKGYFSWPVKATMGLAANFGELRPNHYHMGLDCKTEKRENVWVIAAADGYIAKVKIEPFGFGRAIYINHPNGLTTLYAHLNGFYPALEKYITSQQYALESWKIFIDIPPNLFPVTKGEFIAFSGNTGGSQGPHVHFEIRDTQTDKVLNPLLFGFPITDNIPPDVQRVAIYDRCISTYEQSPKFITIKKVAGVYTTVPSLIIANTNKVSFGVTAFDRYTGSTNKNGIYQAMLYDNEKPVVGFQLDSISYDETRYLNAHIDYKLRSTGGSFVQHLSRLPGYPQGVYKDISGDGIINIDDDSIHAIKMIIMDANGNEAVVKVNVQRGKQINAVPTESLYQSKEFHPGFMNVFENEKVQFYIPENNLYDSFRFRYNEIKSVAGKTIYQLHNATVPVQFLFPIKIKNTTSSHPDKMVMHQYSNRKNNFDKAVKEGDWYKASFRAFGEYTLLEDTIAPSITPVGFKNGMNCSKLNRIAFVIKDATEVLKHFTATLDGKWLRFSNDKGATFIYTFDQYCPPGNHVLKITVEDCVGNKAAKEYTFVR